MSFTVVISASVWGGRFYGDVIAFERFITNTTDIYLLDLESRLTVNLTRTPLFSERFPSWSPDGRFLVFQRERSSQDNTENLFLLDLRNSSAILTLQALTPRRAIHPSWSPDGRFIAFSAYDESYGSNNIHILELESGDYWNAVPSRIVTQFLPTWSPDGRQLAFSGGNVFEIQPEIYITESAVLMTPNTQVAFKRISETVSAAQPDWSADGERVVFTSALAANSLHVTPIDTVGADVPITSLRFIEYPSASPDGKQIAFSAPDNNSVNSRSLYTINIDGTDLQRLLPMPSIRIIDNAPTWLPRSP